MPRRSTGESERDSDGRRGEGQLARRRIGSIAAVVHAGKKGKTPRSMRLISLPDAGLAAPQSRQFPYASPSRIEVGVHVNIDEKGLSGGNRNPDRIADILRSIDANPLDPGRAGHGRKIRIVAF